MIILKNINIKKLITIAEARNRETFIKDLILNLENIIIVEKIVESTEKYRDSSELILNQRLLKDNLEKSLTKNKTTTIKNKI